MLAIIDGDVLAYQACKSRYGRDPYQKVGDPGFTRLEQAEDGYYQNKDAVNDAYYGATGSTYDPQPPKVDYGASETVIRLDADGRRELPEFTKAEDELYMRQCWENFQKDLQALLDKLYVKDYLMAVKGEGCFRKMLYPDYKMNRHGSSAPQRYLNNFVPSIRQLAVAEGIAVAANMREADDLMRTWAEEARAAGVPYIICSIDKDLRCIPGKHYVMHYDEKKKGILNIDEDTARRFYYEQLLKGDPTDNIPGVPRVGEVKAAKLISACTTEQEMQECVVEAYFEIYGEDDWYSHFLINAKLIHLQLHANDYFNCDHWPIIQELRN
jgi:hypothetical protein